MPYRGLGPGHGQQLVGHEHGLDGRFKASKLIRIRLEDLKTKKSISCKYSKICNYGCPKERYVLSKVYNEEGTCGWCNVIDHIYKRVTKDLGKRNEGSAKVNRPSTGRT